MIKGFEHETQPLTDYEENTLLPLFVKSLSKRVGSDSAVTNKEIVSRMKSAGYQINDSRVRKLINHIRTNGLVNGLIATNGGYYIATSESELAEYEESLLGREAAIRAVRLSIAKQRREMFKHEQQTLFTS